VLICPDGRYRLVDFGSVAQALRADGTTVVGTFGYMAPEQFQGRAGPGSDIYGLGATLLTTLTGIEPEQQPHHGLAIDVQQALATSVHPHLRRLLQAMLEPNPDLRPTSLRQWLGQASPLHVGPSHAPNRAARVPAPPQGPQENPLFFYTMGFLVFLLIAIVSLMWIGPSSGWALLMMTVPPAMLSAPRLWRRVVDRQLPASSDLARSRQSGGGKRAGQ
jgi:serine/threonine protein kinase